MVNGGPAAPRRRQLHRSLLHRRRSRASSRSRTTPAAVEFRTTRSRSSTCSTSSIPRQILSRCASAL
jgi:hypothetical protein